MSSPTRLQDIDYPDSDGQPMGESDLHRDWMVRIIELLKHRYRGRRVYVSGDLLVYYEQGNPKKFVVPDAFVVKDSDPGRRRIYKLWEEGRPPDVVFETTSSSTRRKDERVKPGLYRQLGIKEYFLYDPTSDYLKPPLQGYRLQDEGYARLEADGSGALQSRELGLLLRLEGADLAMFDAQTGERLLTPIEAEEAAHEAERAAHEAERAARRAAEAKAQEAEVQARAEREARQAAEEELRRLRSRLAGGDAAAP